MTDPEPLSVPLLGVVDDSVESRAPEQAEPEPEPEHEQEPGRGAAPRPGQGSLRVDSEGESPAQTRRQALYDRRRRLESTSSASSTQSLSPTVRQRSKVRELAIEDRAVSVGFLRKFTDTWCASDPLVQTTRDVVSRVIKPMTQQSEARFVDLPGIREGGSWSYDRSELAIDVPGIPTLGHADFMVSHSWDSDWGDLVAALEAHRMRYHYRMREASDAGSLAGFSSDEYTDEEAPAESDEPYYWIDILAINQHYGTDEMRQDLPDWDEMEAEDAAEREDEVHTSTSNGFKRVIKQSTHGVLMALEPWHDPRAVGRVWCLFEALTGILGEKPLEICVSPAQEESMRKTLFEDISKVRNSVKSLDLREARATVSNDWDRICQLVLNAPGGFDAVNAELRWELGSWLALCVRQTMQRMDPDRRWTSDELVKKSRLGKYMIHHPTAFINVVYARAVALMMTITFIGLDLYYNFDYIWEHLQSVLATDDGSGINARPAKSLHHSFAMVTAAVAVSGLLTLLLVVLKWKMESAMDHKDLPAHHRCISVCKTNAARLVGPWIGWCNFGALLAVTAFTGYFVYDLQLIRGQSRESHTTKDGGREILVELCHVFGVALSSVAFLTYVVYSGTKAGLTAETNWLLVLESLGNLEADRAEIDKPGENATRQQAREAALEHFREAAKGRVDLHGKASPQALRCYAAVATQLRKLGRQAEAEKTVLDAANAATGERRSRFGVCLNYLFSEDSSASCNMYSPVTLMPCICRRYDFRASGQQSKALRKYALAMLWASAGYTFQEQALKELQKAADAPSAWMLVEEARPEIIAMRPHTTEKLLAPDHPGAEWLWQNARTDCEKFIEDVAEAHAKRQKWRAVVKRGVSSPIGVVMIIQACFCFGLLWFAVDFVTLLPREDGST